MPFDSLEQAYHLYNYKRKVFNQIAGAYGVPQLWHDYKRLRDTGSTAKDAAKQVHRYTIKKWQRVLKRVDIRSAEEYERASPDDRKKWHGKQGRAFRKRLKNLQARVNVTDEESPLYQEMVELQELFRFHTRQKHRLSRGNKQDFYSLDLESNRLMIKGFQTPPGSPMPYQELSQEVYETLTTNKKRNYHQGMARLTDGEERLFHLRMASRVLISQPTYATYKQGGEDAKSAYGRETTKKEYENMSNKDKGNYHNRMSKRYRKKGNSEMVKWHIKMRNRLYFTRITRPAFYSPEDEQYGN